MKPKEYYQLTPTAHTQNQAVTEFISHAWRGDGVPVGIAWVVCGKLSLCKFSDMTPAQKRRIAKRFPEIRTGEKLC